MSYICLLSIVRWWLPFGKTRLSKLVSVWGVWLGILDYQICDSMRFLFMCFCQSSIFNSNSALNFFIATVFPCIICKSSSLFCSKRCVSFMLSQPFCLCLSSHRTWLHLPSVSQYHGVPYFFFLCCWQGCHSLEIMKQTIWDNGALLPHYRRLLNR